MRRRTSESLQRLVDKFPMGIVLEGADGQIEYSNEMAVEILGLSRDELVGRPLKEVFGVTYPSEVSDEWLTLDFGDERLIVRIMPLPGPDAKTLQLVAVFQRANACEDIVTALEETRAVDDELQMILNSVYDNIVITDGQGRVLYASSSVERQYGTGLEEIIGKSVEELERRGIFNPSVTKRVLQYKTRQTLIQQTSNGHHILVTGTPVFDKAGRLTRVVSYSHDITELITLREYLEDLEQQMSRVQSELDILREQNVRTDGLVAASPVMRQFLRTVLQVAGRDVPVLLLGESGVGKGAFARLVHNNSSRAKGPFIEINCGAIPESLIESELFGYEHGAFTGAGKSGKPGLIELAHKGTLFLDEVGEMPLSVQVKLLKVIQERKFMRIGGQKERFSDFRLIAATNQDLERMVQEGRFRKDLYFRLNIVPLLIPPLRERKEDIIPLTQHFLAVMSQRHGVQRIFSPAVLQHFLDYSWPGNVRELENMVERLVVLSEGEVITEADLPGPLLGAHDVQPSVPLGALTLPEMLAEYERRILEEARKHAKTTTELARLLGISQPTAVRKLKKYFRH